MNKLFADDDCLFSRKHHPGQNMKSWIAEAKTHKLLEYNVMSLTTVNNQNQPSIRIVYLKDITTRYNLIFYTSEYSQKTQDIKHNPRVAVCFYWPQLMRQLRIQGSIKRIPKTKAKAYFATRSRDSQISSWASRQSHVMQRPQDLTKMWHYYDHKFCNQVVPMPKHWLGFSIVIDYFEFWLKGQDRLHMRHVCQLNNRKWTWSLIQP